MNILLSSTKLIFRTFLLVSLVYVTACNKDKEEDAGGFPDESTGTLTSDTPSSDTVSAMGSDMGGPIGDSGGPIGDSGGFPPDSNFGP